MAIGYAHHDAMAGEDALRELIEDTLNALPERESDVLRLRFGLVDGRMHTVAEVEQATGMTQERIQEIEAKALRLLQHPARREQLKAFLERDDQEG